MDAVYVRGGQVATTGGQGKPKGRKNDLSAAQRQADALAMRKAGHTYDEIADRLGYANASGAWKSINAGLRKIIQEPAEEIVKLELSRLDVALNALWPFVLKGSPRHIEMFLKIMDRRSTYLGLDAPKQVEDHRTVTLTVMAEHWADQTGLDKNEIIAEAQRIVAEAAAESV